MGEKTLVNSTPLGCSTRNEKTTILVKPFNVSWSNACANNMQTTTLLVYQCCRMWRSISPNRSSKKEAIFFALAAPLFYSYINTHHCSSLLSVTFPDQDLERILNLFVGFGPAGGYELANIDPSIKRPACPISFSASLVHVTFPKAIPYPLLRSRKRNISI